MPGLSREPNAASVHFEMTVRSCPVCGSDDDSRVFAPANFDPSVLDEFAFASRKVPEYMHHRIIACPRCDLLYCTPAPTRSSLETAYKEASFSATEESGLASLAYAGFLSRLRLPDRDGALDIGAGDGAFVEQLVAHGFRNVAGVEPSTAPVSKAAPSVRPLIRHAPFRAADFEPSSLSLVTCFQTMEHIYEPLEFCRDAHSLLKDGGAIFVVCHDRRALSARVMGLHSPIFDIEHLQLFSSKSLTFTLERAGFSKIELYPVVNRYPLQYWTTLAPLPAKAKHRTLSLLRATGVGRIRIPLPAGNLAAIGYK